jgi:hypothetical protein
MNAYKVDAIVTENGLAIREGLPLPIGLSVDVIVLDDGRSGLLPQPALQSEYLVGISSLMNEWESAADESAYQNL